MAKKKCIKHRYEYLEKGMKQCANCGKVKIKKRFLRKRGD